MMCCCKGNLCNTKAGVQPFIDGKTGNPFECPARPTLVNPTSANPPTSVMPIVTAEEKSIKCHVVSFLYIYYLDHARNLTGRSTLCNVKITGKFRREEYFKDL